MIKTILIIILLVALFFLSILTSGLYETRKEREQKTYDSYNKKPSVIITGLNKVLSTISTALLTTSVIALILSLLIKPDIGDIMPALAISGESFYDWSNINYSIEADKMEAELETQIEIDPKIAYADLGYLYFHTSNYDKAVSALEKAQELNPQWYYLYDIGICHAYMCNYSKSLKYLKKAMDMDPPLYNRGAVMEAKYLAEHYWSAWIKSLLH